MIGDDIIRMELRLAELKGARDPITREMLTLRTRLRLAKAKAAKDAAADYPRPNRCRPVKRKRVQPHMEAQRLRRAFHAGSEPRNDR